MDYTGSVLIRDAGRDLGHIFRNRVDGLGLEEVVSAGALAVAKRVRRTVYRISTPRVPRSRYRTR